jgi:hypothetical protein
VRRCLAQPKNFVEVLRKKVAGLQENFAELQKKRQEGGSQMHSVV